MTNKILFFRITVFSSLLAALITVLSSCHSAPPSVDTYEGAKAQNAPLEAFHAHLDKIIQDENLSKDEKYSLDMIVTILTNKDVFDKFRALCADDSSNLDLEQCIKKAKIQLNSIYMMSSERGRRGFRFIK